MCDVIIEVASIVIIVYFHEDTEENHAKFWIWRT
jgi:hypothetical protein